jgi:leader peptidase (prepilin peptidase) / N-methyltransferase
MDNLLPAIVSFLASEPKQSGAGVWTLVIALGLVIGSYLNVVIYRFCANEEGDKRFEEKLTPSNPKHSFCPQCLHQLGWIENIPLVSWLIQGGKCKHCRGHIPAIYPAVEAGHAALWAAIALSLPSWELALPAMLMGSCLLAATCIDIKTLKIPNSITLWGTVIVLAVGIGLSPESGNNRIAGALGSALLLYGLVELGKLLFGKRKVRFKDPVEFEWQGETKTFLLADPGKSLEESVPLKADELFLRPSDYLLITGEIEGRKRSELRISPTETRWDFELLDPLGRGKAAKIAGRAKMLIFPQEALGMGDVKLMALVGAGLGWPSALHALILAACAGALYGIGLRLIAVAQKGNPPGMIAFGPWIAASAIALLLFS